MLARRRVWMWPRRARVSEDVAQIWVDRADEARRHGDFAEAHRLYCVALDCSPCNRSSIHMQAGHMAKEGREYEKAERHYNHALESLPDDPELALQLGHFYKTVYRLDEALTEYRRAAQLAPDWDEPKREVAALEGRWLAPEIVYPLVDADPRIVADLLPQQIMSREVSALDEINLYHFGRRTEWTRWGMLSVFSGVEAIRGACYSREPLREIVLVLAGRTMVHENINIVPLAESGLLKAVFNIWVDFSSVLPGAHRFEIVLIALSGRAIRREMPILIEESVAPETGMVSDCFISSERLGSGDLTSDIRALPSVVRPARRRYLEPPERVVVLRTDQLGDMIVSIPALRRLRELFSTARITGLLTEANADFARTLGVFDEIIIVEFPDDFDRRQRTMAKSTQQALRAELEPYRFDLAIDLATSHMSRGLLRLTGAKVRFGFDERSWPWMEGGISGSIRDPMNGLEAAPQSGRILAMIERIATLVGPPVDVLPRSDLDRTRLAGIGLPIGIRYVVLHGGARVKFSRWPHFLSLARRLLDETPLTVVLLTDDAAVRATLPLSLQDNERFILLDRRIDFDTLDALLSFANLFIGNDSGPKHLASLRGTPTLGIHCARVNWSEWAQEHGGLVISRRVPCAGCAIFHDAEDCGKDHACIGDIKVEEVFRAGLSLLRSDPGRAHAGDEPTG